MFYILLGPNKSYKILLRTTKYCCVLQTTTRYLSVLQSTISYYPVLQNTTKTHTLHTQTQAHRAIRQIDAKRPWHGGGGQGGIETTDPQNAYQLVINCLLTFY